MENVFQSQRQHSAKREKEREENNKLKQQQRRADVVLTKESVFVANNFKMRKKKFQVSAISYLFNAAIFRRWYFGFHLKTRAKVERNYYIFVEFFNFN